MSLNIENCELRTEPILTPADSHLTWGEIGGLSEDWVVFGYYEK